MAAPMRPLLAETPLREPGDFRGTIRLTDWSAGFNLLRLQDFPYAASAIPGFWDAQNIDAYSVPGTCRLCARTILIATDAADREYLLYDFNNALYRLPLANFAAADVQKISSATGVPAWAALANIYPGAVAPRGAVVWKDLWVIASAETVVRLMSTVEGWTTFAAPAAVTAPICGQVGASQDERLLVWWEGTAGAGLYAHDSAGAAIKIYPTAGATPQPSAQTCDAIVRGAGSTLLFLRDKTDNTQLVEIASQAAGTTFQTWEDMKLRVWPQCADVYQGEVFFVGQLTSDNRKGVLYHKPFLSDPEIIEEFDTNFGTAGQKGLDWSARCVRSIGDAMWIGGSSREDHSPALYRFFIDPLSGLPSLMPTAVITGQAGPIYSIGILPPGATGASTSERLHLSIASRTYYKDRDNDADPTLDADEGFIQMPDLDLGVEDHIKVLASIAAYLQEKSAGGTVEIQYRIDPQRLDSASSPWRSLGFCGSGLTPFAATNDNAAQGRYGTRYFTLQLRVVFRRATSGLVRDVLKFLSIKNAQIIDAGAMND